MSNMTPSAFQRAVERQLAESMELLKRANRYVTVHPTIGGQKLGEEIARFLATQRREHQEQQA